MDPVSSNHGPSEGGEIDFEVGRKGVDPTHTLATVLSHWIDDLGQATHSLHRAVTIVYRELNTILRLPVSLVKANMDDSTMAAFLEAFTNQPDGNDPNTSSQFDRRSSLASSYSFSGNETSYSYESQLGHQSAPALSSGTSSQSGRSPSTAHSGLTSPYSQDRINEIFAMDDFGWDGNQEVTILNPTDAPYMHSIRPQYLFGVSEPVPKSWSNPPPSTVMPQAVTGRQSRRGQRSMQMGASRRHSHLPYGHASASAFNQSHHNLVDRSEQRSTAPDPGLRFDRVAPPNTSDPFITQAVPSASYPNEILAGTINCPAAHMVNMGPLGVAPGHSIDTWTYSTHIAPAQLALRAAPDMPLESDLSQHSTTSRSERFTRFRAEPEGSNRLPSPSLPHIGECTAPIPPATVGNTDKLHNKVEQRYRSNVKDALEMLRDSVPRLRAIFGTSTPEQVRTTDREDENGLMGGVKAITKPTKKTIMVVSRLYIEHLERSAIVQGERLLRSETRLQELSAYCSEDYDSWHAEELSRSANLERTLREAAEATEEKDSGEDQEQTGGVEVREDGDGLERPRKRARSGNAKACMVTEPSSKVARSRPSKNVAASLGVVAMSSLGLAYTVLPRMASPAPLLTKIPTMLSGHVLFTQPLIHRTTEAFGSLDQPRTPGSPSVLAPAGWSLLVLLGSVLLALLMYHLDQGYTGYGPSRQSPLEDIDARLSEALRTRMDDVPRLKAFVRCGSPVRMVVDWNLHVWRRLTGRGGANHGTLSAFWLRLLELDVGRVHSLGIVARAHAKVILAEGSRPAMESAILALWSRDPQHAERFWHDAQQVIATPTSEHPVPGLASALSLPLSEAKVTLAQVGATSTPVASIGNQATLQHLIDATALVLSALADQLEYVSHPRPGLRLNVVSAQYSLRSAAAVTRRLVADVPAASEASALGITLLTLISSVTGTINHAGQKKLANILMSEDADQRTDIPALKMVIRLLVPDFTRSKRIPAAHLSYRGENLDTLLRVCLLLLKIAGQTASTAIMARSNRSAGEASTILELRALIARIPHAISTSATSASEYDSASFINVVDRLTGLLTRVTPSQRSHSSQDQFYDSGVGSETEGSADD